MKNPYQVWLHFDQELADNAPHEVWVGPGRKMMPLCGQTELIGVTGNKEIVNCEKCLKALDRAVSR
jgi:hypothetical protein